MQVQGAFNALFRKGLRDDFRDKYQSYEPQFSKFLKTGTMDMPEIRAAVITGFNRFVERKDGERFTLDTPTISNVVQGVDREFGLGYMLTRKTVEDDQYGKANQASKWLAHAANMTKEYRAAEFLDDFFTGSTFKGFDNAEFGKADHALLNSDSTVGNIPSSPVQFSLAGVTALMNLAMLLKDENGDPIQSDIDKFIIGNDAGILHRSIQIFGSDKEPFTADNQDNAIKKRLGQPEVIRSVYKTSTQSYFGIDTKLYDTWFLMKREITFNDDFDTYIDAAIYTASMRFLIWGVDWRGWYGANPS